MAQVTHKKYYQIHSWVGVITSILLFVIAFTGAVSVFGRPEIKTWANEAMRTKQEMNWQRFEQLANMHAGEVGEAYLEEVRLRPANYRNATSVFIFEGHFDTADGREEHRIKWFEYDPQLSQLLSSGEGTFSDFFGQRSTDIADFIVGFHADLHLGSPVGFLLTGLLGLTLMASIVTGVVIHKKILRELFTFRPFRSLRLMWQDTHKVLSVWAILFHFAIAFSGAFLGLATVILIPAAAFVVFEGDQEALLETFATQTEPALSGDTAYMRVGEVMAAAHGNPVAQQVANAAVLGWGDKNALMYVTATGQEAMGNLSLVYTPSDATFVESFSNFGRLGGVSGPLLDVMFPLHFGNFGGLFVKAVWAVLGLGTALVALTGMMLWIERRAYGPEGQLSIAAYKRFSRFTIGSCGGLVLACIALFPTQLLLDVPPADTFFWISSVFYAVWGGVTLYAMVRYNEYRTTKELFVLGALGLIGAAVLNWVITGDHPANAFSDGHVSTSVTDIVLILMGIWCVQQARTLPLERREAKRGDRDRSDRDNGDRPKGAPETGFTDTKSIPAE